MNHEWTCSLIEKGEISIKQALQDLAKGENSYVQENQEDLSIHKVKNTLQLFDSLIALEEIKKTIYEHLAFKEIQGIRKNYGLKSVETSMHMAFLGSPGTGKTSVARVIGKLAFELKMLNKGHLLEVDRSDLVGEYIGHTAQKTKKIIQKALGGVLFIDEAYSLCRADERDFGQEAIDILVKEIEDQRHNIILIVAGYTKEMNDFLESNPGLSSRIPLVFHFPDYTLTELMAIANIILVENEYKITYDAREMLRCQIRDKIIKGDCGNGRMVRNILEKSFRKQASRLFEGEHLTREELVELKVEDFEEEEEKCFV